MNNTRTPLFLMANLGSCFKTLCTKVMKQLCNEDIFYQIFAYARK